VKLFGVALAFGFASALLGVACASSTAHPDELQDCTGSNCVVPLFGGGSKSDAADVMTFDTSVAKDSSVADASDGGG